MNGITIIEEHLCRTVELPALIIMGIFVTLLFVGALLFYILIWKYDLLNKKKKEKNRTDIIICSILLVVIYIVFWQSKLTTITIHIWSTRLRLMIVLVLMTFIQNMKLYL